LTHKAVDGARRRSAGVVCLALFHTLEGARHTMRAIVESQHPEQMGPGLTEKEKQFIHSRQDAMKTEGELLRRFGWRLLGR